MIHLINQSTQLQQKRMPSSHILADEERGVRMTILFPNEELVHAPVVVSDISQAVPTAEISISADNNNRTAT